MSAFYLTNLEVGAVYSRTRLYDVGLRSAGQIDEDELRAMFGKRVKLVLAEDPTSAPD